MRDEFINAIRSNQQAFGLELSDATLDRLADYYELVQQHNPILHLVAPCPPEEFATRHILESLTLLEYLPANAGFADVGTGAGLPSIPCLITRDDLSALLIESKLKKARFLAEAVGRLGLTVRVQISGRQFEELVAKDLSYVSCRALDKFEQKLPRLIRWAGRRTLLLFGGNNLRAALENTNLRYSERLMPLSEQRFLFVVEPRKRDSLR